MLPTFAYSQEETAHFQDFTVADGLSSTNAIQIYQDSRGVIWIGTSYGLNSYDGTAFNSYTKEEDGLCHNYIHTFTEDGKGNIWIQAGDYGRNDFCISILDPIAERIYSIEEYTGEPCPFDPSNIQINPTYKGTFLIKEIQEGDRIQFYEVTSDKIELGLSLAYQDTLSSDSYGIARALNSIFKLDKDKYIFRAPKQSHEEGLRQDLFILNLSGEIHSHRPNSHDSESVKLFWADGEHLYHSIIYSDSLESIGHEVDYSFYKDDKLVGSVNHVFKSMIYPILVNGSILQSYPDRIQKFQATPDSVILQQTFYTERNRGISMINLVDRNGNIWYNDVNEVTKLSFRPNHFKASLNDKSQTLWASPIRGIDSAPDRTAYVAEMAGVNFRTGGHKNTEYAHFPYEAHNQGGNLGLMYNDEKLWIGKERTGLACLDLKSGEYSYYGQGLIWQPYKTPDGEIWVGAGEGILRYDSDREDLMPFRDYGEYDQLRKSSIYAFLLNEKGTWLSTSSGMYLVDLTKERVLAYYSDTQSEEFYIPANHITHIHEDQDGIFWLATKGQGLILWNPETGKSIKLTKNNAGLSHNVLYAVYEDDFGNLWLPSDYGLNCLNKESRQVSLFLKDDGLPHNEFNTISHHKDKEGNLYFGTIDGMIEFHPKDFNHQREAVPFIITSAHRIDQQTDSVINSTQYVLDHHTLNIKPSDKAADIQFALLDYKKTDGNQYSYKLEGHRDEWIYQKEGAVRLSSLPYGKYQLLLRGKASGSNSWIDYPNPITIHVAKPFYLQWWFIFTSLATLVGLVIFIIKRNTKKLLERQEELETIVEERTEELKAQAEENRLQAEELKQLDKVKSNFFANISHELRTPLTLILGPLSYILDNPEAWEKQSIQKQLLVMQRNGKSLMDLIEEILDLSKLEANKLELQEEATPVTQFFERLFFVFEPQFESQQVESELNLDLPDDLTVLLDRKKLEKVLNNFLSNAIKFTPSGGKVFLKVSETEHQLKIQVTDTGKGIHPRDLPHIFERFYQSKQADQKLYGGTGIGLALVNEFAQLMGGKAYAESTPGAGSKFFFEIPKKEVALKKIITYAEVESIAEEEIHAIGNDFTIMVTEDNPDMRDFIHQLLKNKYNNILLAKNGAEGLDLLRKYGTDIHLIISDVMMPEVDGLSMLKEIKGNPKWSGIPVVMLTALATERDKLSALTIGVDDYLTKPFSVPELLIRVQNLLFNYHQRLHWQGSSEYLAENKERNEAKASYSDTSEDKMWVDKLTDFVNNGLKDSSLNVDSVASSLYLSPRQLNRRLKSITGLTPAKFIKEVRLQTARKKLENGTAISVTEVAIEVGIENISTFSDVFKKRFGKSPSEYL